MKKVNNKGFAVSTVIYAILILLIIFMFIILGLYRNSYRNAKDYNDELKKELNEYLISLTKNDSEKPKIKLSVKEGSTEYVKKVVYADPSYYTYGSGIEAEITDNKEVAYYAIIKQESTGVVPVPEDSDYIAITPTYNFVVIRFTYGGNISGAGDAALVEDGKYKIYTKFATSGATTSNAGTYYVYVKDASGNVSYDSIKIKFIRDDDCECTNYNDDGTCKYHKFCYLTNG